MSTVANGYDYSTLSLHYNRSEDKLFGIHTDHTHYQPFADEAKSWHGTKGVYYMVFTSDQNKVDKINPVFFNHPVMGDTNWNPSKGNL